MDMQPDITGLFSSAEGEPPTMDLLTPALIEGELRIRDVDLGARLGFSQPRDIRKIIARHRGALSQMGALPEIEEIVGKGQKVMAYFLNRKQAIFITAKSDTALATDITIEIIERFDAYERGDVRPFPPTGTVQFLTPDDRSAVGGIIKRVVADQIRPLHQQLEIDHANIVELKCEIAAIKAMPTVRLSSPLPPRRSFSIHAGQDRKRGLIDAVGA
jgi:hypothetical protein